MSAEVEEEWKKHRAVGENELRVPSPVPSHLAKNPGIKRPAAAALHPSVCVTVTAAGVVRESPSVTYYLLRRRGRLNPRCSPSPRPKFSSRRRCVSIKVAMVICTPGREGEAEGGGCFGSAPTDGGG